jgi:hypothetical protein
MVYVATGQIYRYFHAIRSIRRYPDDCNKFLQGLRNLLVFYGAVLRAIRHRCRHVYVAQALNVARQKLVDAKADHQHRAKEMYL